VLRYDAADLTAAAQAGAGVICVVKHEHQAHRLLSVYRQWQK
jgi:hypothetical protein